jgi:Mycothiol maleylpyruvate isomerase N-terminal domain
VSFDWAGIVEEEGTALGDAAAVDLGAPVPAAPGWDVTELLRHIGLIHTRTSVILRTGTMERPSRRNGMLPEPPEDGVLDWYRATLAEVVADARAVDDPDPPEALREVTTF